MDDSLINVEKQTTVGAPEMFRTSFCKLFEFFQREIFCDVVIQVGKRSFKCHRAVLASCSPYFEAMFTTHLKEKEQSVIPIHDIDESVLEIVINFAYTAKVDLNTENAQSVLHASSFLQIEPLSELCCLFISSQLDSTNCLNIRELAHRFGRRDLVKKSDIFIKSHFLEIPEEEFVSIDAKQLQDILTDDDLFVESETEVCMALLKWIKHDIKNRSNVFLKLLSHVRLPFLPLEIISSIENEPFISGNVDCQVLLNEAKNSHIDPMTCSTTCFFANKRCKPRNSYAGAIFVIGGISSEDALSSNYLFSLYHDKWIQMEDMDLPRHSFGCTSIEGKVYVFGGYEGGYDEYLYPTEISTAAEVYDPKTNQWSELAPMSTPRAGLGVCAAEGAIYAIGGSNNNSISSCIVERYNILSNVWSTVSPMIHKRADLSVVELNGIVYAMGGHTWSNTCEAYNIRLDKWLSFPPMNQARSNAAAVVLNGYIYMIGGCQVPKVLRSVEKYDLRKMQWTFVSPMKVERKGACAAVLGGYIYVVGGSHFRTVEIYDPENDVWTFGPNISNYLTSAGVTWCNIGANNLKNVIDRASED